MKVENFEFREFEILQVLTKIIKSINIQIKRMTLSCVARKCELQKSNIQLLKIILFKMMKNS